ncbi:MAG: hypothetical protein ACHP6H_05570 [Legionellales bacterium]
MVSRHDKETSELKPSVMDTGLGKQRNSMVGTSLTAPLPTLLHRLYGGRAHQRHHQAPSTF